MEMKLGLLHFRKQIVNLFQLALVIVGGGCGGEWMDAVLGAGLEWCREETKPIAYLLCYIGHAN